MLFSKAKKDVEKVLETYTVGYLGGHPKYSKPKKTPIKMKLYEDRFEFGSTGWFEGLSIPYNKVKELAITDRQVGGLDALAVGILNSTALKQANNICIFYLDENDNDMVIRFEMFSGGTVWGTAKKCQELQDKLISNQIRKQFLGMEPKPVNNNSSDDVLAQIEKLSVLKEKGIITADEFEEKKKALLQKI